MNANATVVLPAQVEVNVFGDDESPRSSVAVLGRVDFVAFRAGFFANQGGRVVTEERFEGEEAAADDDEVRFDNTRVVERARS